MVPSPELLEYDGSSHVDRMKDTVIGRRVSALEEAIGRFRACIRSLSRELFLEGMDGWSPRDVTAHFVGWNRHTIEGCREVLCGFCPFYLKDEPNDFGTVNRESVERYASSDRDELLGELDASFSELREFLSTLRDSDWEKDLGVMYKGHVITVGSNVEGLRIDYDRHREAIEAWLKDAAGK